MTFTDIVAKLPKTKYLSFDRRALSKIDGISLHHSADEGDPWSWARYHTTPPAKGGPEWAGPDGAPGIAYHWAVMRDGRCFKCNLDTTISWHTGGHNWHTLGIVCQGDFTKIWPTDEQLKALFWSVRRYMQAYPNILVGNVRSHAEWQDNQSKCPGTWLSAAVRAAIGGSQ